jgi:hypothetical protein
MRYKNMLAQYNKKTLMHWVYLPTRIVRLLGIMKGDDMEFAHDEKTNKVEFRKMNPNNDKK